MHNFKVPDFPRGGSEILLEQLSDHLKGYFEEFNIILSRCDKSLLNPNKKNVLWQHLDIDQVSVQNIEDPEFLEGLSAIVFVSHWQYHRFVNRFKLPIDRCFVVHNAIIPRVSSYKFSGGKVRVVYTSTPWRGLDILLSACERLDRNDYQLEVFSSTALYGRAFYESNDHVFQHLYLKTESLDVGIYRGYLPQEQLLDEISSADILAYPSNWTETFCLSAVESGALGLRLLLTNLGALPEVTMGLAHLVPHSYDREVLIGRFAKALDREIDNARNRSLLDRDKQAAIFQSAYSWENRKVEWEELLSNLK
jgi:glycosyltransferase involved in cell wall biosynthesis